LQQVVLADRRKLANPGPSQIDAENQTSATAVTKTNAQSQTVVRLHQASAPVPQTFLPIPPIFLPQNPIPIVNLPSAVLNPTVNNRFPFSLKLLSSFS
jgi:hypothetical protein